mmetsp:Transcript_1905/g.2968  ORF Transcript_1905/g.2968 Transcript_1905/m.2968 type:complete len:403 (-) Transcript_1905:443-1651(-)|eukprot:CAMPEP_0119103656 /NCGR_PEP_ID=MMETSP1180-20130426/2051_1 /TAXON_ID=3052 ORGANISM="Chlamydomonas cf sp, Strain CCMP681" /NCGR_SAMPLE_ID=MMETSP1180 /ASSEMBLY_ACC=CAM_ASM_000741 /LENGTH=402 /DNA_ID=CAMNT_0007088219 /DNA_START=97 /DNA_END=1305 /DNA_ORIENTATION=-
MQTALKGSLPRCSSRCPAPQANRRVAVQSRSVVQVRCQASHHQEPGVGPSGAFSTNLLGQLGSRMRLPFLPQFGSPQRAGPSAAAASGAPPGNSGGSGSGGGGGGGGDGGKGDGDDEDRILDSKQVEAFCKEKGVTLPADMLETTAKFGLRAKMLTAFCAQTGFSGYLCRTMPYMRDRILADPLFLFKIGAEVVIDSGCATVAEVRKRGDDFWAEFEFYLSDLSVGLVLDVALVSLMAPAALMGGASKAAMSSGWIGKALAAVPSAFFEANVPGGKAFSLGQRFACLGVKALEYSLAGIVCGLIGQGVCNSIMMLKREVHGVKEDDVAVPPLVKTALVWGMFMGLSSNLRYQVVIGLERVVELTIAKKVPAVAYGSTLAFRFVNNVIGGENFIDMARWAGVQ